MVAANLAVALAQSGRRTLLIDADLRKPRLHDVFQLNNAEGLTTLIASSEPDPSHFIQLSGVPRLGVISSGPMPTNPADLLSSRRLAELLGSLDQLADAIVIDGPQITGFADAPILTTLVDGTLVIVRAGRSRAAEVAQAIEALSRVHGRLIGIVLNGQSRRETSYYAPDSFEQAPRTSTPGRVEN
jgi:capsular exopolysaccharide synthesis family protein